MSSAGKLLSDCQDAATATAQKLAAFQQALSDTVATYALLTDEHTVSSSIGIVEGPYKRNPDLLTQAQMNEITGALTRAVTDADGQMRIVPNVNNRVMLVLFNDIGVGNYRIARLLRIDPDGWKVVPFGSDASDSKNIRVLMNPAKDVWGWRIDSLGIMV